MLWLLCGASYTQSIASAYDRNTSSQGWGYQPLSTMNGSNYHAMTAPGTYGTTTTSRTTKNPLSGRSDFPVLRFRSTSAYADKFDMQYTPLMGGEVVLMGNPFDPDGPGVGELEEDPMPIGDTPWLFLLLLSAGYLAFRYRKKIRTHASADGRFCYFFLLNSRCAFFNCLRYALLVCKRAKAALATTRAASTSLCQWKPAMTRL